MTKHSIIIKDPTMNLIIGGVYEKLDNKRDWLRVDGFTAYDSEGKYLGSEYCQYITQ